MGPEQWGEGGAASSFQNFLGKILTDFYRVEFWRSHKTLGPPFIISQLASPPLNTRPPPEKWNT